MIRTIVYSALAGLLVGFLLTHQYDRAQHNAVVSEMKAAEADKTAQAALSLKQVTDTYRTKENALQARSDATAQAWLQDKEKLNAQVTLLAGKLRSGSVRLTAPGTCVPNPAPDSQAGSGVDAAGYVELSAGTSENLAALAGHAQETALKLNRLQEYVRTVLNQEE